MEVSKEFSQISMSFYSVKYACAVAMKERRDVDTIDLSGFFLQNEDDDDELFIIKLIGVVDFFLVESNKAKWRKHLRREKEKWVIHTIFNKIMCGALSTVMIP